MSRVVWDGDNLIQSVRDTFEELGHVKYDKHSKDYVLWLRDTRDVFGTNKGYIRGDSFPSMRDAKQHAALSTSARLLHYMWLIGIRDAGKRRDKDVAQSIHACENNEPLRKSTFLEEMARMEKKRRKQEILFFVIGVVIGVIGPIISGI